MNRWDPNVLRVQLQIQIRVWALAAAVYDATEIRRIVPIPGGLVVHQVYCYLPQGGPHHRTSTSTLKSVLPGCRHSN